MWSPISGGRIWQAPIHPRPTGVRQKFICTHPAGGSGGQFIPHIRRNVLLKRLVTYIWWESPADTPTPVEGTGIDEHIMAGKESQLSALIHAPGRNGAKIVYQK